MKKCPICNASCFDDMPICFSCMHNFEVDEETKADTEMQPDAQLQAQEQNQDFSGAAVDENVVAHIEEPPFQQTRDAACVADEYTQAFAHISLQQPSEGQESTQADAQAPIHVVSPHRSGRASLHRRGRVSSSAEQGVRIPVVRQCSLPGTEARYELVVSLQAIS